MLFLFAEHEGNRLQGDRPPEAFCFKPGEDYRPAPHERVREAPTEARGGDQARKIYVAFAVCTEINEKQRVGLKMIWANLVNR
jgi:hypothetical protein